LCGAADAVPALSPRTIHVAAAIHSAGERTRRLRSATRGLDMAVPPASTHCRWAPRQPPPPSATRVDRRRPIDPCDRDHREVRAINSFCIVDARATSETVARNRSPRSNLRPPGIHRSTNFGGRKGMHSVCHTPGPRHSRSPYTPSGRNRGNSAPRQTAKSPCDTRGPGPSALPHRVSN
jgi:hypothetical protein